MGMREDLAASRDAVREKYEKAVKKENAIAIGKIESETGWKICVAADRVGRCYKAFREVNGKKKVVHLGATHYRLDVAKSVEKIMR